MNTTGREFSVTLARENWVTLDSPVNSQAEERCGRVDHWQNSKQKQRWLAAALLDIEPRLRRLVGYRHLPALQAAIMKELKLGGAEERSKRAA